ncbi:dyslexia-associated protein KIAA0319 [Diretmus argenteus]
MCSSTCHADVDASSTNTIACYVTAAVASQCWQGATFSEAVVSPAVSSSGIVRVPGVVSLARCVVACCNLQGCDLAWLFERRCYILSCQQRENCRPRKRPGADSYLAFLQRGPSQTLVLQSLVRGEPYAGRWRPPARASEAPGDVEALKDLALFDGVRRDFADPSALDVEYSEGDPEERGGASDVRGGQGDGSEAELFPNWLDLEGRDGLNQSEKPDGPKGGSTESSVAQDSVFSGGKVTQGDGPTEGPTEGSGPAETPSETQTSSESTSLPPSPRKPTTASTQRTLLGTSLPTHAMSRLPSATPRAKPTPPAVRLPPQAVLFPVIQVVTLPAGRALINASQSKGDAASVRCQWQQVSGRPVNLGDSTNHWILNLSNLDAGEYVFRLTVTDAGGLSASTTATVTVVQPVSEAPIDHHDSPSARSVTSDPTVPSPLTSTPPPPHTPHSATAKSGVRGTNRGPVAVVGPDRKLILPVSSMLLDGSGSTDDHAIVSYHWHATSGPPGLKMEAVDQAVATVTGLRVGRYTFRLTVSDQEGATDSASLTVRVQDARSLPPVAHASGSHSLTLPNNSLVLRGSVTDGDQAEVHYLWVRDSQSPAAGNVLYGSETQASLYLTNLVEGTYLFQLRVTDSQGRTSTATATVEVRPDPGGGEELELEMLVSVSQVSLAQRDMVVRQLAALLHVLDNDIQLRALQGHSHLSTVLRFSVRGPEGPVSGSRLVGLLRNQLLREKTDYLLFRVLRVDTVLCLLHCSGRGQCDPITKECVCDPFWTENLIRRFLGDGESNCDWRVLYVILSSFMLIVFILSLSWTLICCCKRRRRTKVRKKTKYTILDNMDEQERVELRPKYSIKHRSTEHNSSLMMSESELDSDQDTIFSRDRPVRSRNRANTQATRNGNAFG